MVSSRSLSAFFSSDWANVQRRPPGDVAELDAPIECLADLEFHRLLETALHADVTTTAEEVRVAPLIVSIGPPVGPTPRGAVPPESFAPATAP